MLNKERGTASSAVLGMWGRRALSMDVSQKGGVPSAGRSVATKIEMYRLWGRKSRCKELQQLLEVERTRVEEEDKGVKGESKRREKSSEAHNATSKRSMDENRNGED